MEYCHVFLLDRVHFEKMLPEAFLAGPCSNHGGKRGGSHEPEGSSNHFLRLLMIFQFRTSSQLDVWLEDKDGCITWICRWLKWSFNVNQTESSFSRKKFLIWLTGIIPLETPFSFQKETFPNSAALPAGSTLWTVNGSLKRLENLSRCAKLIVTELRGHSSWRVVWQGQNACLRDLLWLEKK